MGKICVKVPGFLDLVSADGEPIRAGTVVIILMYSIETEVNILK